MRVSRRTSGGRGEYEVSGETVAGISPRELLDCVILLDLGDLGLLQTGLALREQGGKLRLRRIAGGVQIQRQVAAALLLPEPVRADYSLGVGEPVLQRTRYAIDTIEIANAVMTGPGMCVLTPSLVICKNGSQYASELLIPARIAQVVGLEENAAEFPDDINSLLQQHRAVCRAGGPLGLKEETSVAVLQRLVSERSSDLGIVFSESGDVVPVLLEALRLQIPEPLLKVEEVDPEDLELKRRTVKEWKRWANARGPASARFRQEVRSVYTSTCMICGVRFPPTKATSAGVDAAHILPWAQYDLDSVRNGLCLCKLHHWAFDESLLRLRFDGGIYSSYIDDVMAERVMCEQPLFSLDALRQHAGTVPVLRLPTDPKKWPDPDLILALENAR